MPPPEQFLSNRQRYQPISLPQNFSDEQMVRDWTLSGLDKEAISKWGKASEAVIWCHVTATNLGSHASQKNFCL
jgi:hypothetical protein